MSTATCIVGCKLPNGIFMQASKEITTQEPIMGGGYRDITVHHPVGDRIKINGNSSHQGLVANGLVDGGYALTMNVPKDVADSWFAANKESPMVKNRLVFMADKQEDAVSKSKNAHAVKSGMERLDVTQKSENGREVPSDYRWPRSNNANVSAVKSDSK